MEMIYNDGGRARAGYKGAAGDCAVRAIAIVTGHAYQTVYEGINKLAQTERLTHRYRSRSNARTGVYHKTLKKYMIQAGWRWIPTMFFGSGCKVHLKKEELPGGRLLARVSKHYMAIIDGIINDTYNPSRNGTRCVYGYYTK